MLSRRLSGRRRPLAILCTAVLAVAILVQCAKNPVTGKRELMLMSESQEIRLGQEADEAIVAQYGLVDDPELTAYVEEVGMEIARAQAEIGHRPGLEFHFRLLDDPTVNAFALPGGYVYMTRGILAHLDNEAAMAGVMGHEVGHVTARHGAQRYTQQQLYGIGLGVGSIASETFAQFADLAATGVQLLLLKYGRDDERQSDQLGVRYASRLGYDTHRMADFFDTLGRMTAAAGGGLPSWASTHPDPGERFETVNRLTDEEQVRLPQTASRVERRRYLRRIEGLVFGQNPRHGYAADGAFNHPDLEFTFPVPAGWKVINTATQVQLIAPQENAAVLFMLAEESSPAAAADAWAAEVGDGVERRETLRIGGYPAARILSTVRARGGHLRVHSTWIGKGDGVYVFHGLGDRRPVFDRVAGGFRRLTDPAALAIQPIVLHVVEAPRSGPFSEIVAAYPVPEGADTDIDIDGLALMNGVDAATPIEQGRLIKVLRRRPGES